MLFLVENHHHDKLINIIFWQIVIAIDGADTTEIIGIQQPGLIIQSPEIGDKFAANKNHTFAFVFT